MWIHQSPLDPQLGDPVMSDCDAFFFIRPNKPWIKQSKLPVIYVVWRDFNDICLYKITVLV